MTQMPIPDETAGDRDRKLGGGAFVVGGLSFVPLIGVIFGIAAIVWGLGSRRRGGGVLAIVGAAGIAFTVVLYSGLFYFGFVQRGGIYDNLRRQMAQRQINQLVHSIEFYKVAYGRYPESLTELQQRIGKDIWLFIHDPTDLSLGKLFHYERVGADKYYLRGVGADGQPFTPDDIVPEVGEGQAPRLGLLIVPPR